MFVDKRRILRLSWGSSLLLIVSLSVFLDAVVEAPKVIGGDVTVVQGGSTVLPCKLIESTEILAQISWERTSTGHPSSPGFITIRESNGPIFANGRDERFKFIGLFEESNGSLQLSNATLMDEGIYTCAFSLHPSGIYETKITLNILVPPVASLLDNHPVLTNKQVPLVTCTAAGSKPPAEVKWNTGELSGNLTTTSRTIEHDNGTATTISSVLGVPTREMRDHSISCVITSASLMEQVTLPFNIQIYFPPTEVDIRETSSGSFECVTDANPKADFVWKRPDNMWPQSDVSVKAATLKFLKMTPALNGLYRCEATNIHGSQHGQFTMFVVTRCCTVCWIFFSILLVLMCLATAAFYLYTTGKLERIPFFRGRWTFEAASMSPTSRRPKERSEGEEQEEGGNLHEEVEETRTVNYLFTYSGFFLPFKLNLCSLKLIGLNKVKNNVQLINRFKYNKIHMQMLYYILSVLSWSCVFFLFSGYLSFQIILSFFFSFEEAFSMKGETSSRITKSPFVIH